MVGGCDELAPDPCREEVTGGSRGNAEQRLNFLAGDVLTISKTRRWTVERLEVPDRQFGVVTAEIAGVVLIELTMAGMALLNGPYRNVGVDQSVQLTTIRVHAGAVDRLIRRRGCIGKAVGPFHERARLFPAVGPR